MMSLRRMKGREKSECNRVVRVWLVEFRLGDDRLVVPLDIGQG